jgi:hypothetical protein
VHDLLEGDGRARPVDDGRLAMTLEGYGYRWFRLEREETS